TSSLSPASTKPYVYVIALPSDIVRATPSLASRLTTSGARPVASLIIYKTRRSQLLEGNTRFDPANSANLGLTGNPNTLIFSGATPTARKTEALCSLATRK